MGGRDVQGISNSVSLSTVSACLCVCACVVYSSSVLFGDPLCPTIGALVRERIGGNMEYRERERVSWVGSLDISSRVEQGHIHIRLP